MRHALLVSLSAALLVCALPDPLWAQGTAPPFPRGPGLYFNLINLAAFLVVFLSWVRTCWWVNLDAHTHELNTSLWNSIVCGAGALGVVLVWLLPWFWVSFVLFVGLAFLPAVAYANVRNQLVPPEARVLTRLHLRDLAARWLKIRLPADDDSDDDQHLPIRFIGKSSGNEADNKVKVARAESSAGYKAALELVYQAINLRATDIHLEPTKEEMMVRFRIDGILQAAEPLPRSMGDGIINIFKVLGDLDITEKRKPQDGSFGATVEGRQVDFRLATAGAVAGEKLVMRILDQKSQIISFEKLGMRKRIRDEVHGLSTQPHGMFVVCGPTGAGKSTTLYACLNEIDRFQLNVITLENPVEYHVDNVTQIEVNPKAGKTFASELRSILRQDPDVILLGEIRDAETAEIACQAAQTGHLVFTTLHANDTVTAIGRLIDLGVQPFLVGSALSAVLGQRLVRVLCKKCRVRYQPNPDMLRKANLPVDKIKYFYRPPEPSEVEEPCEHCGGTGYFGRTGIFELLVLTDRIRDMIRENVDLNAIKREAVKNGMKYLQEDGLRQVIEGSTSIQELLRVCK
jgi:type II secretory ATPase GspE/PulE/Tfp pilus assembly ATPase PilB-like protein